MKAILASLLLTTTFLFTACEDDNKLSGTFKGEKAVLGDGTVQTYITKDEQGEPTEVGITISEKAMQSLPHEDLAANLDFPEEIDGTPFQFMGFSWNAHGHTPANVYDKPHFDLHFYIQPEAEVMAITPADTVKGNTLPAPGYLPAGHIPTGLVPQMGNHVIDLASPELNGQPFTTTFIYGTYDGKVNFFEPMITNEFVTGEKNYDAAIKLPNLYEHAGKFYPTRYGFRYDAGKKEYQFYLKDLVQR